MKKTLVALAALAATASFAQSSVTLYGRADASFGSYKEGVTGAKSQLRINDGAGAGLSGSRWGLRVSEDLGGGLKANVVIEAGLNIDNGTPGQGGLVYGRQSFIGLSGGFGSFSMGRHYTAYDDLRGGTDLFGHSSFSTNLYGFGNTSAGNVGDGGNYAGRVDNSLRYATPNLGGLSAAVTLGLGENKPTTPAIVNTAFHVLYANGPLTAGLAYQREKPTATATAQTYTLLAGVYNFGGFKVGANFNRDSGASKATEFALQGSVPVGAMTLTAGYARSKGKGDGADTSVGLQGVYSLSKRTDIYAGLRNGKSKDGGVTNKKITHIATGIRHVF
jgi:predicted porin